MHTTHRHNHHHLLQYCILLLVILTGFSSFIQTTGQPGKQLQIGIITSLAYAVWGIFHHYYDRDLNSKIVVEYIGIAVLASVVVWSLLSLIY